MRYGFDRSKTAKNNNPSRHEYIIKVADLVLGVDEPFVAQPEYLDIYQSKVVDDQD